MKKFMLLAAAAVVLFASSLHAQTAAAADPKDLTGQWQGTAQFPAPQPPLRIVFLVSKDGAGWKTVFNYIDLIAKGQGIPRPADLTLQGSTVAIKVPGNEGSYQGQLSADGKIITGSWSQGGAPGSTLNLARTTPETAWEVPKPPPPPKPMAADANPDFDVLTVKPSKPDQPGKLFSVRGRHIITINTTVNDLITMAYSLHVKEIVNGPDWFATDKFDLDGVPDVEGQPNSTQFKMLFQKALTERFGLVFHHEDKELSAYALTVGKGGPKMKVTADKPSDLKNFFFTKLGALHVSNSSMKDFCDGMQAAVLDKPVVDHTGLTDRYDFQLNWTPDESQFAAMGARIPPPNPDDTTAPPGLYTALEEQLGLKMEATKAMVPAMVIDKAEKPGAN